jgi:hypothetical protein
MNWRVTLRQWIDLDEATRTELLNLDPTTMPRRGFNEQKGMDIGLGSYGQCWCMGSGGDLLLGSLYGLAITEADALDHLGEPLRAVQPAPAALGRLGELVDHRP